MTKWKHVAQSSTENIGTPMCDEYGHSRNTHVGNTESGRTSADINFGVTTCQHSPMRTGASRQRNQKHPSDI